MTGAGTVPTLLARYVRVLTITKSDPPGTSAYRLSCSPYLADARADARADEKSGTDGAVPGTRRQSAFKEETDEPEIQRRPRRTVARARLAQEPPQQPERQLRRGERTGRHDGR